MSDSAGREVAQSEREVLVCFLTRVRDAVVRVSAGLTAEQQRTPGVPSGTSLPGLIRHLTGVEEHRFRRVFLGQERDIGTSMTLPDLSTVATIANPGVSHPVSLRPIVTHMIEETARHAGHAASCRSRSTAPPACETIRRRQRGGTRPLTASHTAVSAVRHVTSRIRLMHGVRSERFPRRRWQSRSSRL